MGKHLKTPVTRAADQRSAFGAALNDESKRFSPQYTNTDDTQILQQNKTCIRYSLTSLLFSRHQHKTHPKTSQEASSSISNTHKRAFETT
ncbi:hypothetical protein QQF64_015764 [Cirrhinus molitorella]|uniref:Uncharacterized protein n=1 Tax=Cirrhinus molitorella TaxID=172907 RepID=A0ABR3NW71_9TELE